MVEPALSAELTALWRRSGRGAWRLAVLILEDPAAADDVLQEAFARLSARAAALSDTGSLDGYLWRTVRHLALDLKERALAGQRALAQRARVELWKRTGEGGGPGGPELEELAAAMSELPLEQREVVLLRVWEGLSFPEVAARVGVPEGTVHSRFRYALTRLRARLGATA